VTARAHAQGVAIRALKSNTLKEAADIIERAIDDAVAEERGACARLAFEEEQRSGAEARAAINSATCDGRVFASRSIYNAIIARVSK